MGGLLRLDGGARLLDAGFFSSRNTELFDVKSFYKRPFESCASHTAARTTHKVPRSEERRWPVRERRI